MWHKKIFWQLYFTCFLIMLVPLVVTTWYASILFRSFDNSQVITDEKDRLYLISRVLEDVSIDNSKKIDSICKEIGPKISTRVTIILPSGRVIGDSEKDPDSMENHALRPEIMDALGGKTGVSNRLSPTLHEKMVYVAQPLYHGGKISCVIRTSIPLSEIKHQLNTFYAQVAFAAFCMMVLAGLISLSLSRRISKPIEAMKHGAQRFARGELGFKIDTAEASHFTETAQLSDALNNMAKQLSERIETITRQNSERDAIFSSMIEGVIALDSKETVISINRAATRMLQVKSDTAVGRNFLEVTRNTNLQHFVTKTLESIAPIETDLSLPRPAGASDVPEERFLQVHGTPLRGEGGNSIGALVVINDITRLKRLENIRREFVANVSHELRTPLTSIKGFVETLTAGAIDNKDEASRFLAIIAAQVDRLNTIIEDLLSLSTIEKETSDHEIAVETVNIRDILNSAVSICQPKASLAHITLDIRCPESLVASVNPLLLEQAVINLIDNAIKYSSVNGTVVVSAETNGSQIEIVVKDEGIGIAAEHLPRLFERFYRVDKARSRSLGGTGLGLAIVKHIALAHSGAVSVESTVGKGSSFFIHLPLSQGEGTTSVSHHSAV